MGAVRLLLTWTQVPSRRW